MIIAVVIIVVFVVVMLIVTVVVALIVKLVIIVTVVRITGKEAIGGRIKKIDEVMYTTKMDNKDNHDSKSTHLNFLRIIEISLF